MQRTGAWVLALCCAACGTDQTPAPRDPFVLVVGGQEADLRASLARARAALVPPSATPPVEPLRDSVEPTREAPPVPVPDPVPPEPRPAPPPAERTVVLEQGMTLYSIAREHLPGRPEDGVRRILERNGWTEAQVRRLPRGTKVKLP